MKPKVSVIVPIYNVAPYLPVCLDNMTEQTMDELEIILVNDGSTDGGGQLADSYAARDRRMVVIHQENQGLAAARNRGLSLASSPFVAFVDADDWIDPGLMQAFYDKAIETEADLVVCNYLEESENGQGQPYLELDQAILAITENQLSRIYFHFLSDKSYGSYVWNKLYRKSVILSQGIRFTDSAVVGGEDGLFNLCYFLHVKRSCSIGSLFYHYRQHEASIMKRPRPDLLSQYVRLVECFYDYAKVKKLEQGIQSVFPYLAHQFCYVGLEHNIEFPVPTPIILQHLGFISKNKQFRYWMKQLILIQLLEKKLPGGSRGDGAARKLRTAALALLCLMRMNRTLLIVSKIWLKYRKKQTMNY